jgi:hypothetical protein
VPFVTPEQAASCPLRVIRYRFVWCPLRAMSAVPRKPTLGSSTITIAMGHKPTCRLILFDHLVSELLEMQRHLEAQRLGGLGTAHLLRVVAPLASRVSVFGRVQSPISEGPMHLPVLGSRYRPRPQTKKFVADDDVTELLGKAFVSRSKSCPP